MRGRLKSLVSAHDRPPRSEGGITVVCERCEDDLVDG